MASFFDTHINGNVNGNHNAIHNAYLDLDGHSNGIMNGVSELVKDSGVNMIMNGHSSPSAGTIGGHKTHSHHNNHTHNHNHSHHHDHRQCKNESINDVNMSLQMCCNNSASASDHHNRNTNTTSGCVQVTSIKSSAREKAAREKALQEIRNSLQPFANNDNHRPTSSASSTSDSSSPGQTSGIGSSVVSSNYSALISPPLSVSSNGQLIIDGKELLKANPPITNGHSHYHGHHNNQNQIHSGLKSQIGLKSHLLSRDSTPGSSVRSESPSVSVNGHVHTTSGHNRLLPDQPRILNANGVPVSVNGDHSHGQHHQHHPHFHHHTQHAQLVRRNSPNCLICEPPPPLPPPRGAFSPPPPLPPFNSSNGSGASTPTSSSHLNNNNNMNNPVSQQSQHAFMKRALPNTPSSTSTTITNGMSSTGSSQVNGRTQAFSYASSASSSSPQRGTSPISFMNGHVNGNASTTHPTSRNGISCTSNSNMSNLNQAWQVTQLVQQLQKLGVSSSSLSNHNHNHISNQHISYPQSPASLCSLYSSLSSPPPSYAASSSSGRQSPTPTMSSSSDYATVPISMNINSAASLSMMNDNANGNIKKNMASSVSATSTVTCSSSAITATTSSSSLACRSVQAWTARQAQSPVIMQSVKSTQVQKPVLQTAIAPTTPPLNALMSGSASASAIKQTTGNHVNTNPNSAIISHHKSLLVMNNQTQQANIASLTSNTHTHQQQNRNPPPYPSGYCNLPLSGSQSQQQKQQQATNGHTVNPPPPSYASAVQQVQQQSQQHPTNSHTQAQVVAVTSDMIAVTSVSSRDVRSSSPPPPPPPPPYAASLTQSLPQETTQIISVLTQYGNDDSMNTTCIHVPTTEPPSYASSVAALAAQRAGISTAGVSCNSQTTQSSQMTVCTSRSSNMTHQHVPTRPPPLPPTPGNSDLVNTVESICSSQVSALQGFSNNPLMRQLDGPPLPPKPNSSHSALSDSCLDSAESCSECSETTCSTTGTASSTVSKAVSQTPTEQSTTSSASANAKTKIHHSPIPPRKQLSKEKEKERRETKVRNYSPAAFKFFMEQHVENVIKSHQQRARRRQQLESEMAKVGLSEEAQCQMRKMLHQKESNYIRLRRAKMERAMFKKIKTIGVGAFGEVALVKKSDGNQLYAMKTLRKSDVLKRNQVAHVKAERDILAEADNEWVVKLYYSFQDSDNLYFVMDYIPGGDLMSLLIKFGIFKESLARFYIAELVLAVDSVHKMGFIHRDIKPDNILIDRDGHIKLTDFGLCTGFHWTHNSKYYQKDAHSRQDSLDFVENWTNNCHCNSSKPLERRKNRKEHQRCLAHSLVGTPNYIAPEVLMRTGYTQLCDWWSVGVILYEMLVGQPPFFANTPEETQNKVINWEKTLRIPKEAELTSHAKDLILKLCCGPETRLGKVVDEVKQHAFFSGIDYEAGLRKQTAPHIPEIKFATDTSNFDPIDPERLQTSDGTCSMLAGYGNGYVNSNKHAFNEENGKHPEHAFFEFTFRRFFDDGGQAYPMIKMSSENNNANTNNASNSNSNNNANDNANTTGSPVYV